MVIVGIGGKIGHGKDTVADILVNSYGFTKILFSKALKDEVLAKMPRTVRSIADLNSSNSSHVSLEQVVYDWKPRGIRELLQEYGTEVRRGDDLYYWVRKWQAQVLESRCARVVAPDLRFANEVEAIRGWGEKSYMVKVVRPTNNTAHSPHSSEEDIPEVQWDIILKNDGNIYGLSTLVHSWAKNVGL